EASEGLPVGHVQAQADGATADLAGHLLGEVRVEVADRQPRALAHEGLGGASPDAAGAAGDRDDLAGEGSGLLGHGRFLLATRWIGACTVRVGYAGVRFE